MPPLPSPRVLLKLSGESLGSSGIDGADTLGVAGEIAAAHRSGIGIAIVIGGGNIWRFRNNTDKSFLPRYVSDYLGMMATVMNGIVLCNALKSLGVDAECFSATPAPEVATVYSIPAATAVLERGGIAVCAGGTGRPYFTTDTAAALRAVELQCTRVLKASTVDGIYTADPHADPTATLIPELTFAECRQQNYGVMDAAAFALLAEHHIPISVFNFAKPGLLLDAAMGKNVGTLVS